MRKTEATPMPRSRAFAIALTGVLVAGLAAMTGPALASSSHGSGMQMTASTAGRVGTTQGWLRGRTVTFRYSKDFFCKQPPKSHTSSRCEVGAGYKRTPSHDFDPLYVVVPIGFTPAKNTLQCPAGHCIDHPRRIDLSRVFGSGTGHALLPAHSHIVTTAAMHQAEWWNVDVVGVSSQHAWNRIVHGKSYQTIQQMRMHHNKNVTANIASNLFLFFSVLKSS